MRLLFAQPPMSRRRLDADGAYVPSLRDILADDAPLEELEQQYEALTMSPSEYPAPELVSRTVVERMQQEVHATGARPSDVAFLMPHEPDALVDVGALLAVLPRPALHALVHDEPRAFLTEPASMTNRRLPLTMFESMTKRLRNTRGTDWVRTLGRWAGDTVVTARPDDYDAPLLTRAWISPDGVAFALHVFALQESFYVACLIEAGDVYVGAFYMQSVRSHAADQGALAPVLH